MNPQGKIVLSTRVVTEPRYDETRDTVSHQWYSLLTELGLPFLLLPNVEEGVEPYLADIPIRGVILTSGNNLCPATYREMNTKVSDTSPARDKTEGILIELARKAKWPVLGVCRGMQMLNAHFGGKILPNLAQRLEGQESHVGSMHSITIESAKWRAKFGYHKLTVNSFHDQGFTHEELSPQFTAFAVSEKGHVIEGFAHESLPIVGIMWHPERQNPAHDFDRALLKGLFLDQSLGAMANG